MKLKVGTIIVVAIALFGSGCSRPITHLYEGPPLPVESVALIEGSDWKDGAMLFSITAVDEKDPLGREPYAVLPGTHTVTGFCGSALKVVADTGISTTSEMRTFEKPDQVTLWMTLVTTPKNGPVTRVSIAEDDKRLNEAIKTLKNNTLRTVSLAAGAGRKYIVRCELTADYKLTERGVWVEENREN